MNSYWIINDYNYTLQDWLSPEETQKLLEELNKGVGQYNNIVISSELDYDYYYVNGIFIFRRKREK